MIRLSENKDIVEKILKALKENEGYCPCRTTKTPDTKCQCKEFREQESGPCHCGLFVKEPDNKVESNLTLNTVNKMMLKEIKPISREQFKSMFGDDLYSWFASTDSGDFSLLYSKELGDFSIFCAVQCDINEAVEALADCIYNRGELLSIDKIEEEKTVSYEIWIKIDDEPYYFRLFNCEPFFIYY